MVEKCFICRVDIQTTLENFYSAPHHQQLHSILLCQILELPQFGTDIQNLEEIKYCTSCKTRIYNITKLLEQLESLEKQVLREKDAVETKIKESHANYEQQTPVEKFRNQIVNEMKRSVVQDLLRKIKMKQIGRNPTRKSKVRIATGVEIPRIPNIDVPQSVSNVRFEVNERPAINKHANISSKTTLTSTHSRRIAVPLQPTPSELIEMGTQEETELPENDTELMNPLELFEGESPLDCVAMGIDLYDNQDSEGCMLTEDDIKIETGDVDYAIECQMICESLEENEWQTYTEQNFEDPSITVTAGPSTSAPGTSKEGPSKAIFVGANRSQGKLNFTCPTCGEGFYHWSKFDKHRKSHGVNAILHLPHPPPANPRIRMNKKKKPKKKTPKQCNQCGKVLASTSTLKHHVMSMHLGQTRYQCPVCSFGCNILANLKIHIGRRHCEERNFACDLCGRAFKVRTDLNEHLKTKCNLNSFECDICLVKLRNKTSLTKHTLKHHTAASEVNICPVLN